MKKRKPQAKPSDRRGRSGQKSDSGVWIYGWHTVRAALGNPARGHGRLVATAEAAARLSAEFPGRTPEIAARSALDALLPAGAVHQGVALLAGPRQNVTLDDILAELQDNTLVVVLDQVTDPHNIGAVLRSAAAFGAAAVIVQDRGTPNETGALAKAASGALDIVPLVRVTNLARSMAALGREGFWRVGFDSAADRPLAAAAFEGRLALALGAEGKGLRRLTRESCDQLTHIPTSGGLASLNVSNAAAIALFEAVRRRQSGKDPAT